MELITVMILVGILSVVALPRMLNRSDFDAMGFRDGTQALLRYGQKAAVAQRRTVCVHFSATQAWLTVRDAPFDVTCGVHGAPGDPAAAGETLLSGPEGGTPFTVTARPGTGYAPVPANFHFLASGAPSNGGSITVTGASSGVTVEAATGYVH